MGDDSEWMKLPVEQKVEHKTWKARVAGYEDLTKTFKTCTDEKSPEFSKYQGLIKKFTTDSNAIAQEKALDCVLSFLENASTAHIGRIASEVCSGIISKCLNASRAKTKEKGMEALMLIIEAEKGDIVQEELLKGLGNKQPKIVIGCIQSLREGLTGFGTKTLPAKPMMKMVPKLLEDRDKNVREETKQLVIEVYRWVGQAIKPILSGLKPVQLTELETEFENLPGGTPKQTRFLRSQQDLKEKMEAAAEAGDEVDAEDEDEEPGEDLDPFDMLTAVDIISKLPKNYYEQVEAKKWQDRREMLEAVQKLAENPKLEKGDYHDLVKTLKKVISKDTNVMLVTIAAKCITGLANGLRKNFSSHAPGCVDALLEKFREKKITVVTALREAVDAVYLQTTLEAVSESCVEYLNHKTPSVKSETASFLARCFCRATPTTLPKKLLKMFVTSLLKTVNESVPEVREASYQALGTAMKVIGEKHILPFLTDVDQMKMAKIKECCEKAELIGKSGKPVGGSKKTQGAAAASEPSKGAAPKKVVGGPPKGGPPKGGPPRDGASAGGGASGSSRQNTALSKRKPAAAKKGKKGGAGGAEECTEQVLSDEAVDEKASALLSADILTGLVSANWKERLAAMESFTSLLKGMPRDEIPCQVCVRTLCKKPGLKENNFQVMKLKVELVAYLASNSKFTLRSLEACVNDLVDKIGDVKNGAAVQEALTCMAEACSLEGVSSKVISYAFEQKNPKNQSESLTWLTNAIKDFGMKVNVKPMISTIKKAFGATNPAVRTAAISLVGVFHLYMGPTARMFFEDEKPALLQQIDAEIEKYAGQKPPAPSRGTKSSSKDGEDEDEEEEEVDGEEGGGVNVADLVPRSDISEKITSGLIDELNDKNWKVRNEGLQKVTSILNEAKFITPSLGDLPSALIIRLTKDANKVLVQATITICNTLATAMGPNIKKHVSTLGPGILQNFGDSKPQIRQAAVTALNSWVEQGGFAPFLEGELLADVLKVENPNLRAEFYGWAAEKLPALKKLPVELAQAVPLLYAAIEDRKPEVRQKAQEAVLAFMIHLGYDRMLKMAGKLKAGSKDLVLQQLEKARPNLPAKPVKSKPAKSNSAAPAVSTATAEPAMEEEDKEDGSKAESNNNKAAANQKAGVKKVVGGKKGAAPAANSKKKKGEDEEDSGPLLKVNKDKDKRFKDEKTLKTLKWNFGAPQPEFVQQLRGQMEVNVSKTLMEQLFHNDFKQQIKALEALHREASGESMESTIANLDLILKWLTLRFFDTNTTVLLKILEYVQTVFTNLSAQDYHLHEQEAYAFIPYLVNKVGDPKDNVRKDIRMIFKQMCKVYPASKMFNYIIDGLKSKNTKTRTECLEELGSLIEIYGITVCQPSPAQALKLVACQIGQRDNSVRSAALNTCVVAYGILGETIYKYVGKLNDKDMGMLEERIKRTGKTKPASAPPSTKTSPDEKPKVARVMPSQHRAPSAEGRRIPSKASMRRDFALEIDDADSDMAGNIPQLIQHEDLEDLDGPIKLPETRVRPPSPSMKLLSGSNEAKTAVNLVISEIASTDVNTSVRALAQVDEVLRDTERCEALVEHADQLVVMFSMKLRMTYGKHLSPDDTPGVEDSLKSYRSLFATLVSLFSCGSVASEISTDILKDLIYQLSMIMLDPRLEDIEEGTQVIRSVNILLVKVVEKSCLTNVVCALLRLLHDSVLSDTSTPKFQEVVMKCLWKICRSLPQKIGELTIDKVFGDIQLFLKAFPSQSWSDRPSDVPLRTVKTIVHSITKIKGTKVLGHLTLVDRSNSELENYIKKILKTSGVVVASMNNQNDQMNGNNNENDAVELRSTKKDPTGASKRLSKSSHDMLAEIFRKIGSKENTREGLNDLYDFKLKYPDANLDPFLKKSSQYFQSYIERGLKNISTEREAKMKTSSEPAMSNSSSSNSVSSQLSLSGAATDDVKPSDYIERLKILREKCGLDNNNLAAAAGERTGSAPAAVTQQQGERPAFALLGLTNTKSSENNGSNSSLSSGSSSGMPHLGTVLSKSASKEDTSENAAAKAGGVTNLVDLKRRLEKIKSQQK